MATVSRTYMTDDLDGSEDDVGTVLLALDKVNYEIDLSAANEARLREKLERFVAAATLVKEQEPVTRPGRKAPAAATAGTRLDNAHTQAIRSWAAQNGFEVSSRGRISAAVQQAFDGAH